MCLRVWISAVITILLSIMSSIAAADVLTDGRGLNQDSRIGRFLLSQGAYSAMHDAARIADRAYEIPCADKYFIKPINVAVLSPINMPDGAEQPTSGSWAYRYDATRCGSTKRYNLMMTVKQNAPLVQFMLLPGNTITSPRLMSDAALSVRTISSVALSAELSAECKVANISDTAVVEMPHSVTVDGETFEGVWTENWTVQGCGKQVIVPVVFTPDGRGGTSFTTAKLRRCPC